VGAYFVKEVFGDVKRVNTVIVPCEVVIATLEQIGYIPEHDWVKISISISEGTPSKGRDMRV
jgi:hypothetical protein